MEQPLDSLLRSSFGFAPDQTWLAACLAHLGQNVTGFSSMGSQAQLPLVLEQLLAADLHSAGAGGMLPDVAQLHMQPLQGRFLLQVDEVVNISAGWKER